MELQVGGDPELFIFKDGEPISAHPYVPGTKEKPYPVKHGAVQLDGIALEINFDPAKTAEEFEYNVHAVLGQALSFVPKGCELKAVPSIMFQPKYFHEIPQKFKELGCNPDFNAWTRQQNPAPDTSKNPTLRTGSGHITFGFTENENVKDKAYFEDCCAFVQMIDPIWSQWSQAWDDDVTRASLYGAPGAFRPKPFGVEYRRPSNAWLRYPKMYRWIFDLCAQMYDDAICGKELTLERCPKFDNDWLQSQGQLHGQAVH